MIRLYVVLTALLATTRSRVLEQVQQRRHEDRGAISLETVVIALGLFLLAVALVAGLGTAFRTRLNQIR